MNRSTKMLCVAGLCLAMLPLAGIAQVAEKPSSAAQASNVEKGLAGTWQGTLNVGQQTLRLQMKITQSDGKWSAVIYSIDQGGQAMRASSVTQTGDAVKIEVSTVGGSFAGTIAPDGKAIDGTWTQGTTPSPLKFERANADTAWAIPAPPKQMPADADPSFEVATIKPNDSNATQMRGLHVDRNNRFSTDASSLSDLISFAYDVQLKQVIGNENWMNEDRYDILAKPDIEGSPNPAQLKTMVKKLLADRFALKFHEEKKEMSAFVLTVAKDGPKFSPSAAQSPLPGLGFRPGKGGLNFVMRNATMRDFINIMQALVLDRPIVNQTGLAGQYDMNFTFVPDPTMFNGHAPPLPPTDANTEEAPAMPEALEKQAGLKIEVKKTPVTVLVIDHVAKPTGN